MSRIGPTNWNKQATMVVAKKRANVVESGTKSR